MKLPDQRWPHNSTEIDICCDEQTIIEHYIIPTRMISNPPQTTAQHIEIKHWECRVNKNHFGDVWSGVPEEGIAHRNVFEENDNEKDVGYESSDQTRNRR